MTFFIIGIGAYIVISFLSLFVNVNVVLGFVHSLFSIQIVVFLFVCFAGVNNALISRGKTSSRITNSKCYTISYLLLCAICPFPFPSKNTLQCTHFIHNTVLYILENTNQNRVSESDHAVTQKVTQPFPLLSSCFLSIF